MFKPKHGQNSNQSPTRQRLPLVERPPQQEDIAALFTGAMRIKGCSFELPVRTSPVAKVYLITCQFDNVTNQPVWSMYEGEQGSLQLWTCPHSDLDMVFGMICMSAGTNSHTTLPADIAPPSAPVAAPPASQPPQPQQQSTGQYAQPAAPVYQQQAQPYPQQQQQPYPPQQQAQPPYQQQPQQYQQQPPQQYQQQQPQYQQQPPQQYQQQQAYPPQPQGQPYPPQYPPAQNYGAPQPSPYPPQQQAQYNHPPHQPYPPQDWQSPYYQQPPAGPPVWNAQSAQPQPSYPNQPTYPQAQPAAAPASASHTAASNASAARPLTPDIVSFIDLINKGTPNLLLGHLFVEAGIVPERCLDAALKCQELVRLGRLTNEQAVLALKRAAELGGVLDEDVILWASDPDGARARSRAASSLPGRPPTKEEAYTPPQASAYTPAGSGSPQIAPAKPTAPGREVSVMQKVVELLKQAGFITDSDIETARKVRSKHGGDVLQILVSAGKVSGKTMDAALKCQELVTNGRLRIDKAISALHCCERMRVGLDDALSELSIELT